MSDKLFIKGFTYGFCAKRGDYRKPEALDSLIKLKETTVSEWIALSFWTWQEHFYSTEINFDYGFTVTDRDIEMAVRNAHNMGLKVCLKPVVNLKDGAWRARVDFPEIETLEGRDSYWDKWFRSYTDFMCHYAELASELKCEMLCIGCEMVGTEKKTQHWMKLIEKIRTIYSGPLIYNANHGSEDGIEWFDFVDVIGTSAYYPVSNKIDSSEKTMIRNWERIKKRISQLHERFNKPVVFMEIGCRSAKGCSSMPWDYLHTDLPFNEEEQAAFYSSVMKVFWDEPWFSGFFWWDWMTDLYDLKDAKNDTGFNVYGKKAGEILKEWYTKK